VTDDLFDAASMYGDDYLYFFAPAGGRSEFAAHGPTRPGTQLPGAAGRLATEWPGPPQSQSTCRVGGLRNTSPRGSAG
jgi:hypothetical protein